MDADLLTDFLIKVVATSTILMTASLVAERAGVVLAALIIALPLNAGPGFFFVARVVEPAFLAHSALISFTGVFAVHTYVTVYAHASGRFSGFWPTWAVATVVWGIVSWPIVTYEPDFLAATILVAVSFGLSNLFRYKGYDQSGGGDKAKRKGGIGFLLVRALIGSCAVALAATFTKSLGPSLTGVAFAFPVILSANAWMLHTSYGPKFAAATISNTRNGLISYTSFCFALALLPGHVSNMMAWTLALAISVLASLMLLGLRRWRH